MWWVVAAGRDPAAAQPLMACRLIPEAFFTFISHRHPGPRLPEINCPIAGLTVLACNLHWQECGAKGHELADPSEHPATEQNIPFLDRLLVRRSFWLPGMSKQSPAKAVSPKAFRSKAFEVKTKPPTETPPV